MFPVTLYTTGPGCQQCVITERALRKAGVAILAVVDVRESDAAGLYVREELGYTAAPVVVVEDGTGEDHWSGFRPDQIARVAQAQSA